MDKVDKVFEFKNNLYLEGSPVIINSGMLIKSEAVNKVYAKVQFINISKKVITGLKASLKFDDGAETEYKYDNLKVGSGAIFGSEVLIDTPSSAVKSFTAGVTEVEFEEEKPWKTKKDDWEPLPVQENLKKKLDSKEIEIFRSKYGIKKEISSGKLLVPMGYKDLWLCPCGGIHTTEAGCSRCGFEKDKVDVNYEEIKKETIYNRALEKFNKQKYAAALKDFKQLGEYKDAQEKLSICDEKVKENISNPNRTSDIIKKVIKKIIILVVVIALLVGLYFAFTLLGVPYYHYQKGNKLMDQEKYMEAVDEFKELSKDYKNVEELIEDCYIKEAELLMDDNEYKEAIDMYKNLDKSDKRSKLIEDCYVAYVKYLTEDGQYDEALKLIEKLEDDIDFADGKKLVYYSRGLQYQKEGKYDEAYYEFDNCKTYQDAKDKAKEVAKLYADSILEEDPKEAIDWYEKAEETELVNKAMYAYVKENLVVYDDTTYNYLVKLVKNNYEDAKTLYKNLYNISITIKANDSYYNTSTSKTSIPRYYYYSGASYTSVYFHYRLSGNKDALKVKIIYENRNSTSENWEIESSNSKTLSTNGWSHLEVSDYYFYHKITIYNEDTGEVIASMTVSTPESSY